MQPQRAVANRLGLVSKLLSASPLFTGKGRLVDQIGKLASRIGNGQAVFSPHPGARFRVNLHDRIQRQMWGGCYENHVRKCFEGLLEPGDVFLDVGAHIGYHTVVAACLVGPQGKVFAFEPDASLYEQLAENTRELPWVRTYPWAVWKSRGRLEFERSAEPGESGWGTVTKVRDLGKGRHVPVETVSLDGWMEECRLEKLRAIKIDAEGSELKIIAGAKNLLHSHRPVIVIEFNEIVLQQAGTSAKELAGLLVNLDLVLFDLTWPRLKQVLDDAVPASPEVVCIPREQVSATLECLRRAGFVNRMKKENRSSKAPS